MVLECTRSTVPLRLSLRLPSFDDGLTCPEPEGSCEYKDLYDSRNDSRLQSHRKTTIAHDVQHGFADLDLRQTVVQRSSNMASEFLRVTQSRANAVESEIELPIFK
jgi:hypothetical protein